MSDLDGITPEEAATHIRAIANLTGDQLQAAIRWADQHADYTVFEQGVFLMDHRREHGYSLPTPHAAATSVLVTPFAEVHAWRTRQRPRK